MSHLSKEKKYSIVIKDELLVYFLKRSYRRRTIEIQIGEDGRVHIKAPYFVALKEIEAFVIDRAEWISKHSRNSKTFHKALKKKVYDHGQHFLFLGEKYVMSVYEEDRKRSRIDFHEDYGWRVFVPRNLSEQERQLHVKKRLMSWYQYQAREVFSSRLFHFARIMEEDIEKVLIKSQKRIWGSCDPKNKVISLNWQLIMSPMDVLDYVVVHELAHLKVADHSKRFWNRVATFYPHYDDQRKWLKKNKLDMSLPISV